MRVVTIFILSCVVVQGFFHVGPGPVPANSGHTHGDPHFKTFDDHRFSYHGECDLVLVQTHLATGAALRVHVRTKILRSYSYVQGAAIQVGKEVFEVKPRTYLLNGEVIRDLPENFAGYKMERLDSLDWCEKRNCSDTSMMKIDLDGEGSIQVASYKGFLYVQVAEQGEGFLNATGILGATGRGGQFARDGSRLFDDIQFAEEWQVLDTEPKLFKVSRYPQHPVGCISPPENTVRRMIEAEGDLYRKANKACSFAEDADRDFCIFDVLATGDLEMAEPYAAGAF